MSSSTVLDTPKTLKMAIRNIYIYMFISGYNRKYLKQVLQMPKGTEQNEKTAPWYII